MVSDILFSLIILFLPSQLGLHFWPEYSRVLGLKIDYLSPTIYLTHLLVVLLLLLNIKKIIPQIRNNKLFTKTLVALSLVNITMSLSPSLTVIKWVEVFVYYFFFLYIKSSNNLLQKKIIFFYISLTIVFFIQLFQFINQRSLGGVFYWLGERSFTYTTPSIPKYQILNREIIRVPSTFSHTNSLGGFMLLSLISLKLINSQTIPRLINFVSILLSGSKNAILFLSLYMLKKISVKKILRVCITISVAMALLAPFGSNLGYTISSRLAGISSSLKIISNHALFGTGLGAHIVGLGKQLQGSQIIYENLQPVHNIYFLLVTEVGLVGLLFLYFLSKQIKIGARQSLLLAVVFLTGLFDHYWLTLIQNKILLTILLASFPVEYET